MANNIVTINGKNYAMKHCVRARIIFEAITKKMWTLNTLTDQYNYMYAAILAANPNEEELDYVKFLDALDENPSLVATWQEYLTEQLKAEAQMSTKAEAETEGGKN